MEEIILHSLFENSKYFGVTYKFINPNLFTKVENTVIFTYMQKHIDKYNAKPKLEEIALTINNSTSLDDMQRERVIKKVKEIYKTEGIKNLEFLLDKTRTWLIRRKLTESIYKSADILENNGEFKPILEMFEDALKVTFTENNGLNYRESIESRIHSYKEVMRGISTGIPALDEILGGGYQKGTLNLITAPSFGGKSALLANISSNMVLGGNNVLYFTLEMSEYKTAQRIDANILDIDINEFKSTPSDDIKRIFDEIKDNIGELFIKEFPAGSLSVIDIEAVKDKIEDEKGIKFDVIVIDYIGIMASSRVSLSSSGGMYQYVKIIAEECHGLSKKLNLPILSAAQLNRCIDEDSEVLKKVNDEYIKTKIKNIKKGDFIKGRKEDVEVLNISKTFQDGFKININNKGNSVNSIVCSKNHRFPTPKGNISLEDGLIVGESVKII